MPTWLIVLLGTVALIVIAAALGEAFLKRNKRLPLSRMRPKPGKIGGELGLEPTNTRRLARKDREAERLEGHHRRKQDRP